jgi:hypothetical protein
MARRKREKLFVVIRAIRGKYHPQEHENPSNIHPAQVLSSWDC